MSDSSRRVEEIFDRALELTGVDRAEYLDGACAGDAALRREVDALLSFDAAPGRDPAALVASGLAEAAAHAATLPESDEDAPAPRAEPVVIARFEVRKKLGEGGMGVVYEAYDARLDRKVAVKLVRAGSGVSRARLLREAQALAKVSHPNVVGIHEVGAVGDELFVAMELVAGETLRGWLARSRRPWRDVLAMFVAAGRGLAAAHAAGVVHRDFKPDNVLVGRDGRPRVVDFGLARGRGAEPGEPRDEVDEPGTREPTRPVDVALTAVGVLVGTPAFMSPEQFEGRPLDPRSDQWSFAVALFTALFGESPFVGDTVAEIRESVLTTRARPAPRASGVPEEVKTALGRALSRDPTARFATMNDLLEELERPIRPEAENDPSRGRTKRRVAALALSLAGAGSFLGIGRTDALGYTPRGIVGLGVLALVAVLAIGFVLRETIAATAYNRRVAAMFGVPVAAFVVHRLFAVELGMTPQQTLVGDAMILAATSALASVVLERWMLWGVPAALGYAVAAVTWPEIAAPGFGALLLLEAAATVWFWGEKKSPVMSGSGGRSRTVR